LAFIQYWKIKFALKIQSNAWGNYRIFYHKTNKEASNVLCSVVKDLGSDRALKKWGKTLLSCSTACCVLYNRTEQASLFVKPNQCARFDWSISYFYIVPVNS